MRILCRTAADVWTVDSQTAIESLAAFCAAGALRQVIAKSASDTPPTRSIEALVSN